MSNAQQEIDNIIGGIEGFFSALHKYNAEQREKKRLARLNDPYWKAKRSAAAKKAAQTRKDNKLKAQQKIKDDEEGWRLAQEYVREHCTCHLGNPPCSFCTNSNYCEDCDLQTMDDECPKCGKIFEEQNPGI